LAGPLRHLTLGAPFRHRGAGSSCGFSRRNCAAEDDLGRLVTLETGKIVSEGLGEVQEMIDICDFAVGLSRQLYGRTIATERADHRVMETWQPLGVCGVISAFNFPVAVWSWKNAAERQFLIRMAKRWTELAAEKEREVRDAARSAA
jgi:hypothetical protein